MEFALVDDLAAQLTTASSGELDELGRAIALLQRTFAALGSRTPALLPVDREDDAFLPFQDDAPPAVRNLAQENEMPRASLLARPS